MTSRVFLDTSVLFTATLSSTGASREIMRLAAADELTIVLSDYVIKEIRYALQRKVPASLADFDEFLANQAMRRRIRPNRRLSLLPSRPN